MSQGAKSKVDLYQRRLRDLPPQLVKLQTSEYSDQHTLRMSCSLLHKCTVSSLVNLFHMHVANQTE